MNGATRTVAGGGLALQRWSGPATLPAVHALPWDLSDAVVLKAGGVFAVTGRDGDVPLRTGHPLGLYLDDCRHLSGHELRVMGAAPTLLAASEPAGDGSVHELMSADGTLRVRVERRVAADGLLRERIAVHHHGRVPTEVELQLTLAADFRPMLAVRGLVDVPPATVRVEPGGGGLRLVGTTSDGVERSTTIRASRAPDEIAGGALRFALRLQPGGHEALELEYAPAPAGAGARADASTPAAGFRPARADLQADDELTRRIVRRALADLDMLRSPLDGAEYFAAGVPWYATLFGRDSLITAGQALGIAPAVAAGTLRAHAARLGREVDPAREEEPGKVLHELRVGEVAARRLTPLARYYGTVDATPLFLCLLADYTAWSGDLALFRELRGPVEAMLGWLEHHGDHDGDGLLDYRASAPAGLRNQGWKDSDDGVVDEHGVRLEPPIALVEPQGYAIRGLREVARLFDADGDAAAAARLRERADALAGRLERFWIADRGMYGMAIDGGGRTSAALASNQGHLLWSRAVGEQRARAIRDALMGEELFSGWGIRTLGSAEAGYDPLGYHLGTVWPHDTAMCAVGLRAYGFLDDFATLEEALLDAASHAEAHRLPELLAGVPRADGEPPVAYPVACRPQAWAAGAVPSLLLAGLGLEPDGLRGRLHIRRPSLPRWVDRLAIRGLAVAGARADLVFERSSPGGPAALAEASVAGDLELVAG